MATVAKRHPEIRLEIVGDNRTYPRQDLETLARRAGVADRTAIRSYVSDEALADPTPAPARSCFCPTTRGSA